MATSVITKRPTYGSVTGVQAPPKTTPNLNFSLAGNPNTVQPIGVNIQANTSGTTTPKGLSMASAAPSLASTTGLSDNTLGTIGLLKPPVQTYTGASTSPATTTGASTAGSTGNQYTRDASGNWVLGGTQPAGGGTTSTGASTAPITGAGSLDPTSVPGTGGTVPYSSTNPPTYQGLVSTLANKASSPSQDYLAQQARANAYNDQLVRSKQEEAAQLQQNSSSPFTLAFGGGREQQIQNAYLNQQGALASGFQGASTLLGAANTQQSTQQQGLTSAVGAAAPILGQYGQANYGIGGNADGGNLDPQTQAKDFASKVMSGQMTYDQAISSLGYAGNVGTTFLNNAITSAGGNPLQLQAQGVTQQGVISTQGQQVAGYQSALQQGQNLQSQLSDLITTFGLNPNDVNAMNSGLQKIATNVSSPQYKMLQNYVNDIANTYAQVLTPPGGSSTDTSRGIATSMLDATAKGQSILSVMQGLDNAAKAKIAGVSTTGGSNMSSGNNSSASGFGWNG